MTNSKWREVALGQICEFKYGKSLPASEREPGAIGVYGSNGLVGVHSSAVTNGQTIVIGRKGSFGEVTYSEGSCWPIDTTYYVDSSSTSADLRWLYHQLSCLGLKELNRAAAVPGLNREDAYRRRLLLPPVGEQQRIAEILDQADALLMNHRQSMRRLGDLAKSIFLDMFGDPSSNPKKWPTGSLGDIITDGPQNGLYKPASEYGSGVPIVRIDSFHAGVIPNLSSLKRLRISGDELTRWALRPGDLLINRVNSLEYLGKSALVPTLTEPTIYESNMMRFAVDLDIVDPEFLIHVLQSADIKRQILSSAKNAVNQSSINQRDVRALRVILPPLRMQREFLCTIKAKERVLHVAREQLCKLGELFESLKARAFKGEL